MKFFLVLGYVCRSLQKNSQSWQGLTCEELGELGEVAPGSPQKPSFHFSAWQTEAQRGGGTVRSGCCRAPLAPLSAQTVGSHGQQPGWGQEGGGPCRGRWGGSLGGDGLSASWRQRVKLAAQKRPPQQTDRHTVTEAQSGTHRHASPSCLGSEASSPGSRWGSWGACPASVCACVCVFR